VHEWSGLDVGDARIGGQGLGPIGGKPSGVALERVLVDEGEVAAVRPREVSGGGRNEPNLGRSTDGVGLEDDDCLLG
jgi:hypothetical protein